MGGLATAGLAMRVFDEYGANKERMDNAREDRKLALEDRARRMDDEERARRLSTLQEEQATGNMEDWRRTRDTDRQLREGISAGIAKRQADMRNFDSVPNMLRRPDLPVPQIEAQVYDGLRADPRFAGNPEAMDKLTSLRKKAHEEGMGEVYESWSQGASANQIAKTFNRFGKSYLMGARFGIDPKTGEQTFIGVNPDGTENPPVTRKQLGIVLGKEKPAEGIVVPDGGVLADKNSGRVMAENVRDKVDKDGVTRDDKLNEAAQKQYNTDHDEIIKSLDQFGFGKNAITDFDANIRKQAQEAHSWSGQLYDRGLVDRNGRHLSNGEIAGIAAKIARGEATVADLEEQGFRFTETPRAYAGLKRSPAAAAAAAPAGKPMVVQGDTAPTAPPPGAPEGGKWVQRTTEDGTGWVYASPDGKSAWGGDPGTAQAHEGAQVKPSQSTTDRGKALSPDAQPPDVRNDVKRAAREAEIKRQELEERRKKPATAVTRDALDAGVMGLPAGGLLRLYETLGNQPKGIERPVAKPATPAPGAEPTQTPIPERKPLSFDATKGGVQTPEVRVGIAKVAKPSAGSALATPQEIEQDSEDAYNRERGVRKGKVSPSAEPVREVKPAKEPAKPAAKKPGLAQSRDESPVEWVPPKPKAKSFNTKKDPVWGDVYHFSDGTIGYFAPNEKEFHVLDTKSSEGKINRTIQVIDKKTFIRLHSR